MCRSMVDIHCVTAEIRRGKKKRETTGQKYNDLPYSYTVNAQRCGTIGPKGCIAVRLSRMMTETVTTINAVERSAGTVRL